MQKHICILICLCKLYMYSALTLRDFFWVASEESEDVLVFACFRHSDWLFYWWRFLPFYGAKWRKRVADAFLRAGGQRALVEHTTTTFLFFFLWFTSLKCSRTFVVSLLFIDKIQLVRSFTLSNAGRAQRLLCFILPFAERTPRLLCCVLIHIHKAPLFRCV